MESEDQLRRSRRRWRAGFIGLCAILLAGVLAGTYAVLDQGVSLTYLRDEFEHVEEDFAILRRVVPTLRDGTTHADVLTLLRRQNPEALISATDSTVSIGALVFRFGADGRLRAVDRPPG